MSSFWNHNISISIFGESHGPAIGVTMDNLPPGEYIDLEQLREFMARRAPRQDATRCGPARGVLERNGPYNLNQGDVYGFS